jgi:hypothetical protein
MDAVDRLPNLQLLPGLANVEKQAVLPSEWLGTAFASEEQRAVYVEQNDLQVLPEAIPAFMDFYEARKAHLRERLQQRLGVKDSATEGPV